MSMKNSTTRALKTFFKFHKMWLFFTENFCLQVSRPPAGYIKSMNGSGSAFIAIYTNRSSVSVKWSVQVTWYQFRETIHSYPAATTPLRSTVRSKECMEKPIRRVDARGLLWGRSISLRSKLKPTLHCVKAGLLPWTDAAWRTRV